MLGLNKKIIFLGKYSNNNILTGPEKYSVTIYNKVNEITDAVFIEHFFKSYARYNILIRLFGKEINNADPKIIRLGIFRLFTYLLKNRPDIIHILSAERFTIPVYLYRFLIRCNIITTFHGVVRYETPLDKKRKAKLSRYRDYLWEILAVKCSTKLIFLSQMHLNLAKRYYNIIAENVEIIPLGIDAEFSCNDKKDFNVKDLNIVFYAGINDTIERGTDSIINLFRQLLNKNFKLFMIGGENKKNNFDFKIESVAPMLKSGLISFLKDKHIIIKSSAYDSFPFFAIESMSAGLIPVVSDNVGMSTYIVHGKNGFVYHGSEYSNLKNTLEELLTGKYDLNKISGEAKNISEILNWANIVQQYLQLYNNIK